jgi:hypothetical protein
MEKTPPREPVFSMSSRLSDADYSKLEAIIDCSPLDAYRALTRYIESKGYRLVIIPPQPKRNTPAGITEQART